MKLIHSEHLSKRAGGRLVLEDVSLEVSTASIYGIFGRNGSGKSFLLRCLAGLDSPTSGSITKEPKVRITSAIQPPGLAPELTVTENLSLFATLGKIPARRRTNRVAHVIQDLHLTPYKNVRVGSLPYGAVAKTEIARALVADSQLVFIDGLIDVLDNLGASEVWRVITARRREEGMAFVVATTRAENAERCDRLTLLYDGRALSTGTPLELRSSVPVDTVLIDAVRNPLIKSKIKKRFLMTVEEADGMLKLRSADGISSALDLLAEYGSEVGTVYLRQPTLDDVLDDLAARRPAGA